MKASAFESESDTSTIIDEEIENPAPPDHPDVEVGDESSDEVVCVRSSLDYNPAFYNQQRSTGDVGKSDNSDIHHQISVLKIRIHGI